MSYWKIEKMKVSSIREKKRGRTDCWKLEKMKVSSIREQKREKRTAGIWNA